MYLCLTNHGKFYNYYSVYGFVLKVFDLSLHISFYIDAPILTLLPDHSPYYVKFNEKVKLKCIAEGLPLPTVQWFSNGIAVSSVGQPQVSVTAKTSYPHSAVYTCVGMNKFDKESSSITVIVGGRKMMCL